MSCKISREQLWSWIDREAPELEEHLTLCPHCRVLAGEIRAEIGLFAPDKSALQVPVPDMIGPYRIKRLLGEGGQAFVYEAEQPGLGRSVALKVLKGGRFVGKRHIKHFRREARALALLRHHSIATIYEAGRTEEGQHYFAMELVSGTPMNVYIQEGELARKDRLKLFKRICEAVSYAHHAGVIHRDLKPGNIMIDVDGNPKILDFGLARLTDTGVTLATTAMESGLIEGTPRYMSPEQVRGRSKEIDARSDVYALGVILYELLTEQLPYEIRTITPDALRSICEEPPRKPSSIDDALRGDLETIILKALDKEPSKRYQTVEVLAEDIRRYMDSEPILAKPVGRLYILRKKLVKHRILTAAVLIAVVAVAIGVSEVLQPPYDRGRVRQRLLVLRCDLFKSRQDERLIAEATQAPDRYPELVEAVLVKAQAYNVLRELRLAIDLLKGGLEEDPAQWPYRAMLSEIPPKAGKQRTGDSADWGEMPELRHSAEGWYLRSFATFDEERALDRAEEALRHDPHHVLALECVTRLRENRGDLEGALDGASTMLSMGYQVRSWRLYKAYLLLSMYRYPDALECYNAIVDDQPEHPHYYQRRAGVLRLLRQYERAIHDYSRAIEMTDKGARRAWLYYHRGTPNWILGRREDAVADFRRAFDLHGHATHANARVFFVFHELGLVNEAEQALEAARQSVWDDPWLQRIFACLAGEITPGQLVDAVEPTNLKQLCEAYYYAGEVHLLHGRINEALGCFRDCIGTGVAHDSGIPVEPMSEYELAAWRLNQLDGHSIAVESILPG